MDQPERQHPLRRSAGCHGAAPVPSACSTSGAATAAGRPLARRIPYVTAGIIDASVLRRAQTRFANAPIRWLHADIMTAELPNAGFDAVVSNAALHHIEDTDGAGAGLSRAGNSRWDAGRGHLVTPAAKRLMALGSWVALGGMPQSRQGRGNIPLDQVAAPQTLWHELRSATPRPAARGVSVGCCTAGCSLRGAPA